MKKLEGESITNKIPVNLEFFAKDTARAVKRGDIITVIDVLRCSSTIVTALANSAQAVIPIKTVDEARIYHQMHPEFVLAGERRGQKPKGFDLGNSPLEFSPETVGGKHVIITTTNGTRSISSAKRGRWVFIGALLNAEAVARIVYKIARNDETGISLVLSGKRGRFSLEDFICAGAIAEFLSAKNVEFSDSVIAALLSFQSTKGALYKSVQRGHHAQYLEGLGKKFIEDVRFCCQLNRHKVVPYLEENMIVLHNSR